MRFWIAFLTIILLMGCAGTPARKPVCSGNTLRACQPVIYFDEGSTALTSESKVNLDWVYEKMSRFSRKHVQVRGYADWYGRPQSTLSLAMSRAIAVKDYLVQKGIDPKRIEVTYMDEIQPMCDTVDCQELTRRVELKIYTFGEEVELVDIENVYTND